MTDQVVYKMVFRSDTGLAMTVDVQKSGGRWVWTKPEALPNWSQPEQEKHSAFIPNSFQTPNALVDKIMPLLTPPEFAILMFATRHILGWHDRINARQACISLSQFEKTGLSRPTVVKALAKLEEFGLLSRIGEASDKGQCWQIVYDTDQLELDAIQTRYITRKAQNVNRTRKARSIPPTGQSDIPVSPINQLVPLTPTGQSDIPLVVNPTNGIKHIYQTHTQRPEDSSAPVLQPDAPPSKTIETSPIPDRAEPQSVAAPSEPDPQPLPKVPQKGSPLPDKPKQTTELKNAIALLCHGSHDAWKSSALRTGMSACLRDLLELEPTLTADRIALFGVQWYQNDFRGKKGERPKPHQVPQEWLNRMFPTTKGQPNGNPIQSTPTPGTGTDSSRNSDQGFSGFSPNGEVYINGVKQPPPNVPLRAVR